MQPIRLRWIALGAWLGTLAAVAALFLLPGAPSAAQKPRMS